MAATKHHIGTFYKGTAAEIAAVTPPADAAGSLAWSTDTKNLSIWDGSSWTAMLKSEIEFRLPIDGFGKGAAKPTETIIGNWVGYAFSINDLGYFAFEVPLDWDEVSDIDVALHYYIDEAYATHSGEIRFSLVTTIVKEDGTETVDGASSAVDGVDQNIPATAKTLNEYEIAIPAASISKHDVIGFQIKRIALTGGTNPTAEPVVVGVEVEYTRKV